MSTLQLFIIFCLLTVTSWSQNGKAVFSQSQVEIGETFTLTYVFPVSNENVIIEFQPNKSFLVASTIEGKSSNESIEIYTSFKDTLMNLDEGPYWIGVYELICWDSGKFLIPPVSITINGSDYTLPQASLTCKLIPHQKSVELYDIKENFTELPKEKGKLSALLSTYGWVLLILLFIGLLAYILFKRRKKSVEKVPNIPLSLEDRTLIAIDALMNKKLWKEGKLKDHYIELALLLKSFLGEIYELELKERTSSETVLILKQKNIDDVLIKQIKEVLQQADLVKFAKSDVVEEGVIHTTNVCKLLVKEISKQFSHV
jgi:cbb3-type cytochrome oxidase subunit 3